MRRNIGSNHLLGLILSVVTISTGQTQAQVPPPAVHAPSGLVGVIDLTADGLGAATRILTPELPPMAIPRTSLFEYASIEEALAPFRNPELPEPTAQDQKALALALDHPARVRLLAEGPLRLTLFLIVNKSDQGPPKIDEVKETKRDLVIVRDLGAVAKNVLLAAGDVVTANVRVYETTIDLAHKRADVTAKASSQPGGGKKAMSQVLAIVTGPTEHLGLSVDLPLNRVDELKFDKDKNALVEKEAPGEFLASINWWLGDIATPSDELSWKQRIGFKLMVRGSKKPLESMGFGLTVRVPRLEFLGQGLAGLQPFVAAVWRREDEAVAPSGGVERGYSDAEVRAGISFDVSKLADWWKKDKAKE